ncbi:MAG: KH domain-containing protein [Oscillospiraceae bacterium]
MEQLISIIAKGLVDDKDAVNVTADAPLEDGTVVYHLHVAPDDMGRVIGKQGRIAKAIRTVVRAAANKTGEKAAVEID